MPGGVSSALVTGAGGTVGSAVAQRLARAGVRVRAMTRRSAAPEGPGIEPWMADLLDADSLSRAVAGVELVVHCAAELSLDEAACRRTNVEGTEKLLLAMRGAGVRRLVHVSTVSAYDPRGRAQFDEESPLRSEPLDPYGFSKAEAERLVAAEAGLRSVILRPVVVLSMHRHSFWGPKAVARAKTNPDIPVWPLAELPFVHVDNLAEAVWLAAQADVPRARAFNVIDGVGPTNEYLAAIARAARIAPAVLPPSALSLRFEGERIRRELGYAPVNRWREFLDQLAR